ncbi:YjdJ family protein [Pueribacillus theae]|uniref:YjdJ family protein n=1 Tax=Pueribacillus theae TaxID=2171751 RepID=UPI001F0B7730|nr:YjdJ family protein [Pueribacillus theae]
MIVIYIIQYCFALVLLIFSTFASWYEGSAILDDPWEWKYSTPFSQFLYGRAIQNIHQISQLDHFVYAAKFHPTFPIIMVISSFYLLILLGFHFLKGKPKWFIFYQSFLGGVLACLAFLFFNSVTIGGQIFFYISLLGGVLCIVTAVIFYFSDIKSQYS